MYISASFSDQNTMSKKFIFDHFSAIIDYKDVYFKKKSEDCILYAEDGTAFKIHKEVLGQTVFLRKILFTTINHCCDTIEIICPCTKEELEKLVHFLYHGEIQCENIFESFKGQEDLSKIFGFPKDFNVECQVATLLDDPALSSVFDVALYEEIINTENLEIIAQSSDIEFMNKDITQPNTGNEVSSNIEYANDSVQGNLIRGIDNCSGLWYKSIGKPWTTVSLNFFLYQLKKQKKFFPNSYYLAQKL